MGLVTRGFTFTNGTVADATEVNTNENTLYTLVNGNIDDANIDTASAFAWTSTVTTTVGLTMTANSLTTGKALLVSSSSDDLGARTIVSVRQTSALASSATAFEVIQAADKTAVNIDQNGDGFGVFLEHSGTTVDGIKVVADGLTTANALHIYSNSSDATTRSMSLFHNDNTSASGTAAVKIIQDAAQAALSIDMNGDSKSIFIDSEATTIGGVIDLQANTLTSGVAVQIDDADALTSGALINLKSNSSDATARNLAKFHNDNTSATGARCLTLRQDAVGTTFACQNPSGTDVVEIREDGGLVLPDIDAPASDELVYRSGASIWAMYNITAATTIATLDSFNTVSAVAAGWGTVTVSWGTNKMADTVYCVLASSGKADASSTDVFTNYGTPTRSQVTLVTYDLSTATIRAAAYSLSFAIFGDR